MSWKKRTSVFSCYAFFLEKRRCYKEDEVITLRDVITEAVRQERERYGHLDAPNIEEELKDELLTAIAVMDLWSHWTPICPVNGPRTGPFGEDFPGTLPRTPADLQSRVVAHFLTEIAFLHLDAGRGQSPKWYAEHLPALLDILQGLINITPEELLKILRNLSNIPQVPEHMFSSFSDLFHKYE